LALVAAAGGFALTAADAAALAVGSLVLVNAAVDFVEAHGIAVVEWSVPTRMF
jgi:hypothetical protein